MGSGVLREGRGGPSLSTPEKRLRFSGISDTKQKNFNFENVLQFWEEKGSRVNVGEPEILPHNFPTETQIMNQGSQPNYTWSQSSSTNPGPNELIADQWDYLSQPKPDVT